MSHWSRRHAELRGALLELDRVAAGQGGGVDQLLGAAPTSPLWLMPISAMTKHGSPCADPALSDLHSVRMAHFLGLREAPRLEQIDPRLRLSWRAGKGGFRRPIGRRRASLCVAPAAVLGGARNQPAATSRTAPWPPGRDVTSRATPRTPVPRRPRRWAADPMQASRSLTSLPTYATRPGPGRRSTSCFSAARLSAHPDSRAQLPGPGRDDRIGLGGDDHDLHAALLEPGNPQPSPRCT